MKTALLIIIYILLGAVTFAATKDDKYSILYGVFWPITWIVEIGFLFALLFWPSLKKTVLDTIFGKEVYYYNPKMRSEPGRMYAVTVYRCRRGRKPVPDCTYVDWSYSFALEQARTYVTLCNKSEIH